MIFVIVKKIGENSDIERCPTYRTGVFIVSKFASCSLPCAKIFRLFLHYYNVMSFFKIFIIIKIN